LCPDSAVPGTISSVLVEKDSAMASRQDTHRSHFLVDVSEVDANSQGAEIGVRPELNILMPFHFFATIRPFEVEL
jgi:hypothetical protein